MRYLHSALLMLAVCNPCETCLASDWREFRGPQGSSVTTAQTDLPSKWDVATGENIAWEVDLPGRGVCGPIVVDGRVIVTASSGTKRDRLHVLAFDSETGNPLWQRQFWATGRTNCHPTSANAAPTPASDGQRVYAFYSSNDLVCLDLDGNMQWVRGLVLDHPGLGNDTGMASSPVVVGDVVVVQCECQANSFAAAFDRVTGEEMWKVNRPSGANWSSPVAIEVNVDGTATAAVVLQSGENLVAYAASNGTVLWELPLECSGIPSSAGSNGVLYVPGGNGLTAVATDADRSDDRELWSQSNLKSGNPSPVVADDQLLLVNRAGVLTSASLEDGSTNWKKRLGGSFWATPVATGNMLYAVNDSGKAFVVDVAEGEIVSECDFGEDEEVLGSPAIADGALFVRSHRHLWKIADGQ